MDRHMVIALIYGGLAIFAGLAALCGVAAFNVIMKWMAS